ncbi:MAG: PPOX class F420-dependent oxidoreductase [Acidimicrobiales bacterium]
MELSDALAFARDHRQGVLVTQKRDGRPQLSNIMYVVDDAGVVRISVTADRAKYKNLQREPKASLHVTREDFYAYAVLDADVELSEVAQAPDDDAVEELVALYKAMVGEHDDWHDYRASMVKDRRLVARLTPTHAYGMLPPAG